MKRRKKSDNLVAIENEKLAEIVPPVSKQVFSCKAIATTILTVILSFIFLAYLKTSPPRDDFISDDIKFLEIYEKYDTNGDGLIDFKEFKSLAYKILNQKHSSINQALPIQIGDEYVTLKALFKPLDIKTMNKVN